VSLNSGDSHTEQFYSPDRGILDIPQWVQEPPISLATSMSDHFSDISPDNSLSSYDLYPPFQIGEPRDPSLQEGIENIPLPSFPGNQAPDYTFHSPNSLVETIPDSNPTDSNPNTSSSVLEPTKAPELRSILPMPPSLRSDTVSDTNSDDGTQQSCTKPGQRRRFTAAEKEETARIREIGSCARCIERKIKVSSK
jgi:hypothetical protein